MGAANITPATTGIGMGGGFRRFIFPGLLSGTLPFLPWSSGPPGSAWVSLACTTAQLPRERGRRRMEDPGRAARRGVVDIQAKTPARETGPKPQSSERGVITLWE